MRGKILFYLDDEDIDLDDESDRANIEKCVIEKFVGMREAKNPIISTLLIKLDEYFPQNELEIFSILDHKKFLNQWVMRQQSYKKIY